MLTTGVTVRSIRRSRELAENFGTFIRSMTISSSRADTSAGGFFGMKLTRLPGFDKSSAPDLSSPTIGLSD